ncbi:MFS transporter [Azospirillaceae bacterium]
MESDIISKSARLSLGFSWAGHFYMHIMAALYLTVVLGLERDWSMSYDSLIRLWTVGSLMIGLGAPLAGWLGDRWSDAKMMVLFFLITGGGAIAAGCANSPDTLSLGLFTLGLGASIYHPVGMAWVTRCAVNRGQALGAQGVFGSLGVACAASVAGGLTTLFSWRAAFIVPGGVSIVTGLALLFCLASGRVVQHRGDPKPQPKTSQSDAVRVFIVLSITMFSAGIIWNAAQVITPKWFEFNLQTLIGGGTLGVGGVVTLVYLLASVPQWIGGRMADRGSVKTIYVTCLALQIPLLAAASIASGASVPLLSLALASTANIQIPAESLLLARYTPDRHRGLAFGGKFILSFGAGPIAVQTAAAFYAWTGAFSTLFLALAALAATATCAALLLPKN